MTASRSYRSSKIRMFMLFLLLASVIWVLAKFSKESTATVTAKLDYINAPDTISVAANTERLVSFDITGNGFQFLSYKLKQPHIEIDLAAYYRAGEEQLVLSNTELAKLITEQLNNSTRVRNVTGNDLQIDLDVMRTRMVPIILDESLSYADGFRAAEAARIVPDSVLLTGPSQLLEAIDRLTTKPLIAADLSDDLDAEVELILPESERVRTSHQQVAVSISVKEFTQKTLDVPIQLYNIPQDIAVQLIPDKAVVSFEIAVDRYQTVSELDFEVRCDFARKHGATSYLVPEITRKPEGLFQIDLETDKLEYLIFSE